MASFKKTQIRSLPKIGQKVTADTLYWRKLNVKSILCFNEDFSNNHLFQSFLLQLKNLDRLIMLMLCKWSLIFLLLPALTKFKCTIPSLTKCTNSLLGLRMRHLERHFVQMGNFWSRVVMKVIWNSLMWEPKAYFVYLKDIKGIVGVLYLFCCSYVSIFKVSCLQPPFLFTALSIVANLQLTMYM